MFLTEKQLAVLNFVRDFIQDKGISPTLDEMSQYFGVSKVTIYEHVTALERKGAVRKSPNRKRSIVPIDAEAAARAPVLTIRGRVAAGAAVEAIESSEAFDLADLAPPEGARYLLRVVGDSMIDAHICSGDMVVVEPASSADDGDIVVAMLPDPDLGTRKATLKRFYREPDRIRLQPANQALEPLFVRDVEIQGRVVGVLRSRV